MKNPHPYTIRKARGNGKWGDSSNPRHRDWDSGHAIGYSKGLREGIEASKAISDILLRLAIRALRNDKGLHAHTISLLEAAVVAHQPEGRRSKDRNFEEVVGL